MTTILNPYRFAVGAPPGLHPDIEAYFTQVEATGAAPEADEKAALSVARESIGDALWAKLHVGVLYPWNNKDSCLINLFNPAQTFSWAINNGTTTPGALINSTPGQQVMDVGPVDGFGASSSFFYMHFKNATPFLGNGHECGTRQSTNVLFFSDTNSDSISFEMPSGITSGTQAGAAGVFMAGNQIGTTQEVLHYAGSKTVVATDTRSHGAFPNTPMYLGARYWFATINAGRPTNEEWSMDLFGEGLTAGEQDTVFSAFWTFLNALTTHKPSSLV